MRIVAVLAALVLSLAGCSDSTGDADDTLPNGQRLAFQDARTSATTGAITGVVVDPSIFPVPGLQVRLHGSEASATTDAAGLFSFSELDPGLYSMTVNGTGYLAVQTTAEVKAGTVTKVKVVVPIDPAPVPYHATQQFHWFDTIGVVLVDFVIDLVDEAFLGNRIPNQCENCHFDFQSDGPVDTFVLEAQWEEQISDPTGNTRYYWNLAIMDNWRDYEDDYFNSGQPAYVSENRFKDATNFTVSMYADETWVTVDQSAEIFVTMFYHAPPPEGWSFMRGDP